MGFIGFISAFALAFGLVVITEYHNDNRFPPTGMA